MKKLILVLFLLISSISFAQRIEFIDSTGHLRQVSAKYPLPTVASVAFPDSLKIYFDTTFSTNFKYINSVSYKDTLSKTTLTKTYIFGEQYPRIEVSVMYDSGSVGNDSLRIKHVGAAGDTTPVYVLDTLTGARQPYIVNVGDKKYHSFRIDKWCPYALIFEYSDAVIYTTKFIIVTRGVKY